MTGPVDHDAETQCGATELGVAIEATGPQLAYSEELPVLDYPEPMSRGRVALIAGGIVLAAAVVAGVVLWAGRARHDSPTPVAAPSSTTTTVASPPPPPVVTTVIVSQPAVVTKTVAAPAPQQPYLQGPLPDLVPYNGQFLNVVRQHNWFIADQVRMLQRAHETCQMLRDGDSRQLIVQKLVVAEPQLAPQMAYEFTQMVTQGYPNCP